jgi:hypothetical protein
MKYKEIREDDVNEEEFIQNAINFVKIPKYRLIKDD